MNIDQFQHLETSVDEEGFQFILNDYLFALNYHHPSLLGRQGFDPILNWDDSRSICVKWPSIYDVSNISLKNGQVLLGFHFRYGYTGEQNTGQILLLW